MGLTINTLASHLGDGAGSALPQYHGPCLHATASLFAVIHGHQGTVHMM